MATMRVGNVPLFTRKATGLVRQAGALDVFIYNVNFINIAIGVAFMFLWMPAGSYPGTNMIVSTLICMAAVLPTSLVYAMFASAMPRSGGEYVYVSRILSPLWGLVANWNYTIWSFFYIGVPAAFLGRYGISGLMRSIGVYTGHSDLINVANFFESANGTFLAGAVLIIAFAALFVRGLNAYMRVQNITFIVSMLSLVALGIVFAVTSAQQFIPLFNQYMSHVTGKANLSAAIAHTLGAAAPHAGPFSLHDTLSSMTWPFTVLGFSIASAYIGGEIKGASRAQLRGMPGSMIYSGVCIIVLVALVLKVVNIDFIGSLGALSGNQLNALNLGFAPTFADVGAMLTHNLALALLIGIGFALWTYAWLPIYIITCARNLLAWALDGLLPQRIADVDERLHTPIWAVIISAVLGLFFLAIYAYDPNFTTLVGFFGQVWTFILTSIAAIVFPFRQRDVFEGSPVGWRIGGIPVISVIGALSVLGMLLVEWAFLNDPNSGISFSNPGMLWINVAVFASGFVFYFGARFVRQRQGINLDVAFAEIPPE